MNDLPTKEDVDLVVFDFDGVMTDNRVLVLEDGREAVFCSRADGLGCDMLRAACIPAIILSTEVNPVVGARAKKIGLPVIQGVLDKAAGLMAHLTNKIIDPTRVMFVGNDRNDLPALRLVGWPAAPSDAAPEVLAVARLVTHARGGYGVVREIAGLLTNDPAIGETLS